MSQEKVEYKKDLKSNRKKLVRKKKVETTVATVIVSIVCVAIVGWIGYSIYTKASAYMEENKDYVYNEISTDALQDYIGTLND